jgi:hypothetical protein
MMTLNLWSGLAYYPSCIQNQFKSVIAQVNNELMNTCTMECMAWMEKQMYTGCRNERKAKDQTAETRCSHSQ